jgi:hypothetical protein
MNDVKVTVGGNMEDEASRRFIDAWHRAERGETFEEHHHAFEGSDTTDQPTETSPKLKQNPAPQVGQNIDSQKSIQRSKQLEILDLFGTIDFDPEYDYKKNRQLDSIEVEL